MTLYISWSALRSHETCKQQGFLKRSGHRAPLQDTRNYFPGTVTDRVVRDWLTIGDPANNLGAMPGMVSEIMDREKEQIATDGGVMKWRDKGDRAKIEKDCIEAVTKIEPALLKFVVPFEYQADFSFKAPLKLPHPRGGSETVMLNGYMDIIVKDSKGRWWIWDVKHTRDGSYWRKTVGQLSFYDFATKLMFGDWSFRTGLLQPLCPKPVFPYVVDNETRAQLMQRVAGMAWDVWSGDKTPRTDNKECGYCDVRHACSKFAPVQDGANRRISLL